MSVCTSLTHHVGLTQLQVEITIPQGPTRGETQRRACKAQRTRAPLFEPPVRRLDTFVYIPPTQAEQRARRGGNSCPSVLRRHSCSPTNPCVDAKRALTIPLRTRNARTVHRRARRSRRTVLRPQHAPRKQSNTRHHPPKEHKERYLVPRNHILHPNHNHHLAGLPALALRPTDLVLNLAPEASLPHRLRHLRAQRRCNSSYVARSSLELESDRQAERYRRDTETQRRSKRTAPTELHPCWWRRQRVL